MVQNINAQYLLRAATTDQTGATVKAKGSGLVTFRARVAGTGAVAGSVAIQGTDDISGTAVWTTQATITLSGTDSDSGVWATLNSLPYWRAVLSSLSGTGATVNVTMSGN